MRTRLIQARWGLAVCGLAAAVVLAAPAARAFTIENKDAGGQYGVPKFDLEEQSKRFSTKTGTEGIASGRELNVPLSNGSSLNFGVNSGSAWDSRTPGALMQSSRQNFNRITAPPGSMEYNGIR